MATDKDLSEEIEQLGRRAEQDPRTHTFARLADLYRKTGDLARALEVVERGLKHHPHYLNARIVHARVLSDLGRTSEARGAFQRVLQIDSENLVAQAALAELGVDVPSTGAAAVRRDSVEASGEGAGWLARLDEDWQKTQAANGDEKPSEIKGPRAAPSKHGPTPDESGTADAELETATLAALYVRQGLFDRAIAIYERLLARDPYNARLASALEDARRRTDPADVGEGSAEGTPSFPSPAVAQRSAPLARGGRRAHDAKRSATLGESPARSPGSMRALLGGMLDARGGGLAAETPGRWPEWLVRLGRGSG